MRDFVCLSVLDFFRNKTPPSPASNYVHLKKNRIQPQKMIMKNFHKNLKMEEDLIKIGKPHNKIQN